MYPIKSPKDGNWLAETINLQIPIGEMLSIWSIFDKIWMTYLAKYQKVITSANFPENKKGVDNEIRNKCFLESNNQLIKLNFSLNQFLTS